MSTTKAHQFQTEQARNAKPPKPPAPPKKKPRAVTDATGPAQVGPEGKRLRGPDARTHAGRRGGAVLEPVPPGTKPSRKSTRKSADHVKQSTNLQLKASRASAAPTTRATRGAATTQKARAAKPAAAKTARGRR